MPDPVKPEIKIPPGVKAIDSPTTSPITDLSTPPLIAERFGTQTPTIFAPLDPDILRRFLLSSKQLPLFNQNIEENPSGPFNRRTDIDLTLRDPSIPILSREFLPSINFNPDDLLKETFDFPIDIRAILKQLALPSESLPPSVTFSFPTREITARAPQRLTVPSSLTPNFSRDFANITSVRAANPSNCLRGFATLDRVSPQQLPILERAAQQAFGLNATIPPEDLAARAESARLREPATRITTALALLFGSSPERGFIGAQQIESNPEARRLRRQMLRSIPNYKALLALVDANTEFQRDLEPFIQRLFEMRDRRVDPEAAAIGMSYRVQRQASNATPIVIGMLQSPRLSSILHRAINRTVGSDTREFERMVAAGQVGILPEIYGGSGSAIANYVTTRFMIAPELMGVIAEKKKVIGGEFWLVPTHAWTLNSETRPLGEGLRNSPGGGGTLNGLGAFAPVQQADITNRAYGGQNKLGAATRANIAQTALAIAGKEIRAVYLNNSDAEAVIPTAVRNKYPENTPIAEFRDSVTFKSIFVATNRIVSGSGLLDPVEGLDTTDEQTRLIMLREYAKVADGKPSKIYTLEGFMSRYGDPTNAMPFRGLKEIYEFGGGDSHRIVTALVRGHSGSESGRAGRQLDDVESITVFGAPYTDRDQFLEPSGPNSRGARPVYGPLAIEFEGDIDDFRYSTALFTARAVRLDDDPETGRIAVTVRDPKTGEETRFVPRTDDYIHTNLAGRKLNGLSVYKSLEQKHYTPDQAKDNPSLIKVGTVIRYCPQRTNIDGTGAQLDESKILAVRIDINSTIITMALTTPQGLTVNKEMKFDSADQLLVAKILFGDNAVLSVGEKVRDIPTDRFVYAHLSGMPGEEQSQLIPVARQVVDYPVFIVGAGAELPLSATVMALIKKLGIKENTVALWANQRQITLAAIYFAQMDLRDPKVRDLTGFTPGLIRVPVVELPIARSRSKKPRRIEINFSEEAINQKIPLDMPREDLLRLGATVAIGECRVPKLANLEKIRIEIERLPSADNRSYVAKITRGFPDDPQWLAVVNRFLGDPDVQRAIHERLTPFNPSSRRGSAAAKFGLRIEIPVGKGVIEPGRLTIQEYELDSN